MADRPTPPSVVARGRERRLKRVLNVLAWHWNIVPPKAWDQMDEPEQLAWARNRLRELAERAESEKVQCLAAGSLARSLDPKGHRQPKDAPAGSVGALSANRREYLECVIREATAEVEQLKRGAS